MPFYHIIEDEIHLVPPNFKTWRFYIIKGVLSPDDEFVLQFKKMDPGNNIFTPWYLMQIIKPDPDSGLLHIDSGWDAPTGPSESLLYFLNKILGFWRSGSLTPFEKQQFETLLSWIKPLQKEHEARLAIYQPIFEIHYKRYDLQEAQKPFKNYFQRIPPELLHIIFWDFLFEPFQFTKECFVGNVASKIDK
jgi:hypothetical protein